MAKLSYKEQRELDALPDEIAALEAEQADLNTQLSDPEIFKDYEKAGSLQGRGGNRNAAAGEIGAVGNAGSETERGVI